MGADMQEQQTVIRITAAGGPEVLLPEAVPVPRPRDGEVLIAVKAAGVNRHDCNQRRRGPGPEHSDVPGLEVAGVVVGVGHGVAAGLMGQSVCALTDGGGYAPFAIAQAAQALPVPDGLSWTEAAALPEAAFTVWHNFFGVARLGAGESVLIHGGTSGVGTLAMCSPPSGTRCTPRVDHPTRWRRPGASGPGRQSTTAARISLACCVSAPGGVGWMSSSTCRADSTPPPMWTRWLGAAASCTCHRARVRCFRRRCVP